ncbi:hypothetical protein QJS10_CPA01g00932 [Acorus calamus]|uniref:Uncharacterized protein n=1 Tax=Acorus calamus TaxID=4465 RepID=A0AAV9FM20_ACOCL|nr:hypothetical protein QJS10_CPA01g00934 [Acorus calamus]KAK1327037.1 hypothetical protein QJS10_CPA01g00932 [Acorus calamus]
MATQIPKNQIVDNYALDKKLNPFTRNPALEKTTLPSLEAIKGGGGSIKVGTTGTIGSLMTKEMETTIDSPRASTSSQRRKLQTMPVSIPCGGFVPKKPHPKKSSSNEASTSNGNDSPRSSIGASKTWNNDASTSNGTPIHRIHEVTPKMRQTPRKNFHRAPILRCDGITAVDCTPNKEKLEKKGSYIVEVVDLKCSNPMSSRFKKLGFSKLSDSVS